MATDVKIQFRLFDGDTEFAQKNVTFARDTNAFDALNNWLSAKRPGLVATLIEGPAEQTWVVGSNPTPHLLSDGTVYNVTCVKGVYLPNTFRSWPWLKLLLSELGSVCACGGSLFSSMCVASERNIVRVRGSKHVFLGTMVGPAALAVLALHTHMQSTLFVLCPVFLP